MLSSLGFRNRFTKDSLRRHSPEGVPSRNEGESERGSCGRIRECSKVQFTVKGSRSEEVTETIIVKTLDEYPIVMTINEGG